MKKSSALLIIALAVLGATSCQHKIITPDFETVTISTPDTTGIEISYKFAAIANAAKSSALNNIEQSQIQHFFGLDEFKGSAQEAADKSLLQTLSDYERDAAWYAQRECFISAESMAKVVDTLAVYTIIRTSYTGGAHGMHSIDYYNYSLRDGHQVKLGEILSDGEKMLMDSLIHHKLYKQYEVKDSEGLADVGFFPESINVPSNFAISDEGITFYYNPYDIGCYALGAVEVKVSKAEYDIIRSN